MNGFRIYSACNRNDYRKISGGKICNFTDNPSGKTMHIIGITWVRTTVDTPYLQIEFFHRVLNSPSQNKGSWLLQNVGINLPDHMSPGMMILCTRGWCPAGVPTLPLRPATFFITWAVDLDAPPAGRWLVQRAGMRHCRKKTFLWQGSTRTEFMCGVLWDGPWPTLLPGELKACTYIPTDLAGTGGSVQCVCVWCLRGTQIAMKLQPGLHSLL
jgi:hypothetical protein